MSDTDQDQPRALITGVSRVIGIGHAIAERFAADGFEVVTTGWVDYDRRMPWGADDAGPTTNYPANFPGRLVANYAADFEDPSATDELLPTIVAEVGPVTALVMCHCESVDSDIQTTTVEAFDRHMAVNARATWQLVRGFAQQFPGPSGSGRILAITSDHTPFNLPYGASKGAMDRIVIAAATELAELGVTANVINPGGTDTGWMSPKIERQVLDGNLQPRIGLPGDVANLAAFLCSSEGQWINGQLLYSNGGIRT